MCHENDGYQLRGLSPIEEPYLFAVRGPGEKLPDDADPKLAYGEAYEEAHKRLTMRGGLG